GDRRFEGRTRGGALAGSSKKAREVFGAGVAVAQVGGDSGQASVGVLAGEDQVGVDVEQLHRLLAADVGRVGGEEADHRGIVVEAVGHGSISPSAARVARSLRRASNIVL